MVTTRDAERFSRLVSLQYADIVDNGLWFTPLREALDAYVDKIQERVTGVVRLKLFKGDCRVVGRKSPFAVSDHAQSASRRRRRVRSRRGGRLHQNRRPALETAARKSAAAVRSRQS